MEVAAEAEEVLEVPSRRQETLVGAEEVAAEAEVLQVPSKWQETVAEAEVVAEEAGVQLVLSARWYPSAASVATAGRAVDLTCHHSQLAHASSEL